jgi:hypothetical protein
MDKAFTAVDAGLAKIEERVDQSSSKMAVTIADNMEEWFVRKLTLQGART